MSNIRLINLHSKLAHKDIYQHNFNFYVLNGVLFALTNGVVKSYLPKFLDRIHGTPWDFTLFNALPGLLAALATIPGMIWLSKSRNIQGTMIKMFLTSRLFWLLYALVPLLPEARQPIFFVLLTAFMNFPEIPSVTALQSFAGDIFSQEQRTNAISLRNKVSTLAQIVAMLIMGQLLSLKRFSPDTMLTVYQVIFVLSFLIGLWEITTFARLKPLQTQQARPLLLQEFLTSCKGVWYHRKFRLFLLCSLLFHFGWQMGWPLFALYQIQYLGAGEGWLTILTVSMNIVMFFSFNFWNRLIIIKGNSLSLAFATFGMAVTPILYALSPNLWIMTLTGIITGFFTAGTITVILTSLLEAAPENDRVIFIGIHATLTNLTLVLGPMLGNLVLVRSNIYVALLVTSLFRLVGSTAFYFRNRLVKAHS